MITSDIRRILKGVGCHNTEELNKAVNEIIDCFLKFPDYDAASRQEITKLVSYLPVKKYSVIIYGPFDSEEDTLISTNDKEEAMREFIIYKNRYMTTDDVLIKIVDNETGREYVDGNWYE